MTPYSEIPEGLKPINKRHINSVDKLFRMHAGASTHLTGLNDGVFELETRISKRPRPISVEQMIRNIARSWHGNPELASCHTCRVRVYQSAGPTGVAVPAKNYRGEEGLDSDAFKNAVWQMLQQMRLAEELPAPLIAKFTISLTRDEQPKKLSTQSPNSRN